MAINYRQALIQTLLKIAEDERVSVDERLSATRQVVELLTDRPKQTRKPKRAGSSILGTSKA